MKRFLRSVLFGFAVSAASCFGAENLQLRPGDHVAIIGNTLADRMQHSGYFEALTHQKFPKHELVFRNLGFAADEVTVQPRSENFGTNSVWLAKVQADVVFAFFGFNESFKGQDGLASFRTNLTSFIADTRQANYSGKGSPRLVLFSPIAAERHTDPNFPDPSPVNRQLAPYVNAMREVAQKSNVPFVDLFAASQKAYAGAKKPLTINGIHLNDAGYKALAPAMFSGVFGENAPAMESTGFENLIEAVNAKNAVWFSRYRTVDGYNVYGGRSKEAYAPGKKQIQDRSPADPYISNFQVMQREMSQRDVMTANREKRVWARAQGGDLVVKDDNLPEIIAVPSNKPGANEDGSHVFLSGTEAVEHMKVPPGCKLEFIASEKEFPELSKPVQMAFDTKGRLWVAVWPNYPERTPTNKDGDKLLVFDLGEDGKVKKMTTFLDDLNCPTGFQFYKDGVIVVQAPDVWFVRDTDGDGKADWKERILNGMDSADSHHTANSLCYEPGGAIYLSDGVFHRTSVETARGPVRNVDAAIYRLEPRTSKFERYIAYGFANPHGRLFDYWGNDIVTDATGNNSYFGPAFSGHLESGKHSKLKDFWDRPMRPSPGTAMLSSRHFPEEMQNEFLNINVIGFQGIYRVKVTEDGGGLRGQTVNPPMLEADIRANGNCRPIAADVAPDGSLYMLDWHNPIIGHLQHHLRDPNRDHVHGRIYRITYPGRPLLKPVPIDGQPIARLLDALKEPENNVRTRAKIELDKHPTKDVIAAVQKWAKQFDPKKKEDAHHLLEALWVHQWHNVINESLLKQLLQSPEPRARAQAVRVLCYWRDRVSEPLALLKAAANDPSQRVRLEAVRAASFFEGNEAMEVAYQVTKHPMDYYVDYTFKETTKQLQKSAKDFVPKDPALLAASVSRMSDKDLLAAPNSEPVLLARIERKTMDVNTRGAALEQLAALRKTDRPTEAVAALTRLDEPGAPIQPINDLALLLTTMTSDLDKVRNDLQRLTSDTHQPAVRRAANAVIVAADGKPDPAWSRTAENTGARVLLIESIGMLPDPTARAAFQPLLASVLNDAGTRPEVRSAALRALPLMGTDYASNNFQLLAANLGNGKDITVSAGAIRKLPRDAWAKDQAAPLADAILKWAKSVPTNKRTEQQFVETVQVGMDVATLLPAADSTRVRKELLDLGVSVFAIKTVREQMRYDVQRIVVEAGKPFEIIFENDDMMPHNLIVVQPGARAEIGAVTDKMQPTTLDRQGRPYIPEDRALARKVLAATRLIEPGQKETLKMVAPRRVGTYEYVCTFPEHWKVMFGELVVVKDRDAVLQASAQAAPAPQAHAAHDHNH
jgi:glucose/arabinose dehydrogenase/azurin